MKKITLKVTLYQNGENDPGILPPYRVNPVTLLDTVIVILFVVLAGFLLVKSAIVVSLDLFPLLYFN